MFKINNNLIQLSKSDKIAILNKILSLQQLKNNDQQTSHSAQELINKMKKN